MKLNSTKHYIIVVIFLTGTLFTSCKKMETVPPEKEGIAWMKVLDENISGITEADNLLGQNGKVITDANDTIYLYYFTEFPNRAVVIKCDPDGMLLWKKTFSDCIPMDMILLPNGDLALAVKDVPGYEQIFNVYVIHPDLQVENHPIVHVSAGGSGGVVNMKMVAFADNSIAFTGTYKQNFFIGWPYKYEGVVLKVNAAFVREWDLVMGLSIPADLGYQRYEQNSMVVTPEGKYLTEFSFKTDPVQEDSLSYGLMTGIVDPDSADYRSYTYYETGYSILSDGFKSGFYNSYAGQLMEDGSDGAVFHYSNPVSIATGLGQNGSVKNGFVRINFDAEIKDTIPIPLPEGYRIISCTKGIQNFLLTACKSGTVDVSNDYDSNQTLFLSGNSDWQTTRSFTLQKFYSDFFSSSAPTSDGSFIIMGKIQSFNGASNQLILMKWKNL